MEVKALFDRVSREQNGRLDILVNNAYAAVKVRRVVNRQNYIDQACF